MWIWCEYDVNMMWIWCEYDIWYIYDTWIIMDSKKKYHFGIWYGIVDITWYYMIWSYLSPIFLTAGCSSFTLDYMMLEPAKRGLSHDAWTCAGSGDVFFLLCKQWKGRCCWQPQLATSRCYIICIYIYTHIHIHVNIYIYTYIYIYTLSIYYMCIIYIYIVSIHLSIHSSI